ncbi:MAG: glycosyltransferase family 4 protein [Micromonosporaceae bacterium]|nr:glycosyltransferase family 4 protein [Micromonosporaceae bacterium]
MGRLAEQRRLRVDGLKVGLLTYRGNPFSGGQGIYVRNLSRELARAGHQVTVLAGPPYPVLDEGVRLVRLPSLDLYREPDPFRMPRRDEYRDWIDLLEVGVMMTAGFPEPLTFSLRARRWLARAGRHAAATCPPDCGHFDVIHDNQCLGYGLLGVRQPLVATVHHPIQVDRDIELAAATGFRRVSLRRWYGFTTMQRRVARRLRHVITVSEASAAQVTAHLGVPRQRQTVVPVGTDTDLFSPDASVPRVPGRVVTTASADVPLKGLAVLVEAIAKLRTERPVELVVIGTARSGGAAADLVDRYGLADAVRFTGRVSDAELVDHLRRAQVAVVPSLFEGFSLPAVEAMACATPLVATTGGALPEVVGPDGHAALLVPPGDAQALAAALGRILDDPDLGARLGAAGRARVVTRFTWRAAADRTAEVYRRAIAEHAGRGAHGRTER